MGDGQEILLLCWTIDNSASLLKLPTGDIVLEHSVGKTVTHLVRKETKGESSEPVF